MCRCASPIWVGGWSELYDYYASQAVAVSGGYAYVADFYQGLLVFDISNPRAPSLVGGVGWYYAYGQAYDVAVSGDYAYVVNWGSPSMDDNFEVVDISDPAAPLRVGAIIGPHASDVAVSGSYAYLANDDAGLRLTSVWKKLIKPETRYTRVWM